MVNFVPGSLTRHDGFAIMSFRNLTLGVALFLGAAGVSHAASREAEVLKPVNDFLSAITRRDKAGMLAETVPHMEIMSARGDSNGGLRRLTVEDIADRIVAYPGGKMAETLHDPIVHIDDDLAVVWSAYTWTVDGRFHHCASETFNLLKLKGKWTIVGVADTAREDPKTCSA